MGDARHSTLNLAAANRCSTLLVGGGQRPVETRSTDVRERRTQPSEVIPNAPMDCGHRPRHHDGKNNKKTEKEAPTRSTESDSPEDQEAGR